MRTAERARDSDITEAVWQTRVLGWARDASWELAYHPYYSERSAPGWPDLVLVSVARRRTIFAELKSRTGRVEPDQRVVLTVLAGAGNEVHLWRPADEPFVLRALAAPRAPRNDPTTWPLP